MTSKNDLIELEEALERGKGFENTKLGKEIGFNEDKIKLETFNSKNDFLIELKELVSEIRSEEDLHNDLKENFNYNISKLIDFIEFQTGSKIQNNVIKTSDVKRSLEIYKDNVNDERVYENKLLWSKTLLEVMRGKDFDIIKRFSSDVDTLVSDNPFAKKKVSPDLRKYIEANNLNLVEIFSITPTSLDEKIKESMNDELNYHYANEEAKNNTLKEALKEATKIDFSLELREYIKNFNLRHRDTGYKEFYDMMVCFAIEKTEEALEVSWDSINSLRDYPEGELLENSQDKQEQDDYKLDESFVVREIDGDIYTARVRSVKDREGSIYKETWTKNGEKHRNGSLPAVVSISHHYIPSETYLDDASKEYWKEGILKEVVDSTYDDVLSKKSLAERRYIGCDVDNDVDDYELVLDYERKEAIKNQVQEYKEKNGIQVNFRELNKKKCQMK